MAGVLVDWGSKEFVLRKTKQRIPWKLDSYQGKTSESDGYTIDWSDPEGGEEALSYVIDPFVGSTEADFEFPHPVKELAQPEEVRNGKTETLEVGLEDRSLGESSIPLTAGWIRDQLA